MTLLFVDQEVFRYLNTISKPIQPVDTTPVAERLTFNTYHPILGYNGVPNISKKFINSVVTHNSLGNRGRDLDCANPNHPAPILVSGDSQAWGYGVGDEETIAASLERQELARAGTDVPVLNFGTSGYGPDQSLLKYLLYGRICKPRLVIFILFVGNDFDEVLVTSAWGAEKPRMIIQQGNLCLTNIPPRRAKGWPYGDARTILLSRLPWLDRSLILGSYLFRSRDSQILEFLSRREFLSLWGDRERGVRRVVGGDLLADSFPCFKETVTPADTTKLNGIVLVSEILEHFKRIVTADGGQFRVLIVPTTDESRNRNLATPRQEIREILKRRKTRITDLGDSDGIPEELTLNDQSWVWTSASHLSARASEIAAKRVLSDAIRDGQL
jgi:hypothetical protein